MIGFDKQSAAERKSPFRFGFYAGLLAALVLGIYLFELWDADNQVELHTTHLLAALEKNKWSDVGDFLDSSYSDQWGHDRAMLLLRLQRVLPYAQHLHIQTADVLTHAAGGEGEWRGRVTLEADPNEVSALIKDRVNTLNEPFTLQWRRISWKPWDWKLVRATNPALEIPESDL